MSVSNKTTTRQKLLSAYVPSSQYCTKSKKNPKRPHGLTVVKSQNSYTSSFGIPTGMRRFFTKWYSFSFEECFRGICSATLQFICLIVWNRDVLYGMNLHSLLSSVNMNLPSLVTNNDMNLKSFQNCLTDTQKNLCQAIPTKYWIMNIKGWIKTNKFIVNLFIDFDL